MIYSKHISTTSDYTPTSPQRTRISVTRGLVYKLDLFFPPGSEGLLGVLIRDGGYQVWPSSLGEWFVGDNELISFDDLYLKEAEPYMFDVFTYNLDAANIHAVNLRIGLVSKEIYMARFLPSIAAGFLQTALAESLAALAAPPPPAEDVEEKTPYAILFGES